MKQTIAPKTAEFYLPTSDGEVALFYRWRDVKYNDGRIAKELQYLSTCGGGWQPSFDRNQTELLKKLIPINQ